MRPIDIEIRDLQLVKMIAEVGNLSRSAECLNLSQPALSHQLLKLEDRLGSKLFIRQARRMALTDAGQDIVDLATDILERVEQTEQAIKAKSKNGSGQLKIATECMPAFTFIPCILSMLHTRFPNVTVTAKSTHNLYEDLRLAKCDMAIAMRNTPQKGIIFDRLFSNEIVLISAPDDPRTQGDDINLECLAGAEYYSVLSKKIDPFFAMLTNAGIEPKSCSTIYEVNSLMNMVSTSNALAFMPLFAAQPMIKAGKLKKCSIKGDPLIRTWYMARLQDQPLPTYAKELIKIISEHMSPSHATIQRSA